MSTNATDSTAAVSGLTKIEKFFKKVSQTDLLEELESLDQAGLEARLCACEANLADTEDRMANDSDLKDLKQKVKDARGPYSDEKKLQRAIQRACHLLLAAKGLA